MSVRLKKIADQVMVITGASSGIGLTTARKAAQQGARLILAARNEDALQQLTHEIAQRGGQAFYVVADVGKEEDVRAIGRAACERFGGFDTWINDAGIGIYGNLLDVDLADFRRLFDTNFWGVVHGSLEAARHLQQRSGKFGGAIINLGSEVSDRSIPLQGMYASSKHAVKAFTDALRMELEKARAPISVSLVKPTAIDTPFPQHAKNYMKEEPQLPTPIYAPEIVADVILHCAQTPVRDMFAGGAAKLHSVEAGLMPRVMDWLMEGSFFDKQKKRQPASHAAEALYAPTTGLQQRSGTRSDVHENSPYTRASMQPMLTAAVLVGTGLAAAALFSGGKSAETKRPSPRDSV